MGLSSWSFGITMPTATLSRRRFGIAIALNEMSSVVHVCCCDLVVEVCSLQRDVSTRSSVISNTRFNFGGTLHEFASRLKML